MEKIFLLFSFIIILSNNFLFGQRIEKIEIPKGIAYNYCDSLTFENAKRQIESDLSSSGEYSLISDIMFVGPVLWTRLQKTKELRNIKGGNTTLLVDDKKLSAKLIQDIQDSKKVWDEFRKEINGAKFKLRKANPKELQYYWSVISFDIDEPLVIVETDQKRYILNISPKTMKLLWLDQAP
jgi:hypothetical protein